MASFSPIDFIEHESHVVDGGVVIIGDNCGNYITAWEDKRTVTLEKKLEVEAGSSNRQHWTVIRNVQHGINGGLTPRFYLKSIYGTFLSVRPPSTWLAYGFLYNKREMCQTASPQYVYPPSVSDHILPRREVTSKWFYSPKSSILATTTNKHNYYAHDNTNKFALYVLNDGRFVLNQVDSCKAQFWHLHVVDHGTSSGIRQEKEQPPPGYSKHSVELDACKMVVINNNFNHQITPNSGPGSTGGKGAPFSLYNSGQNSNGSGTQNNGDVSIRNEIGRDEKLKFQFYLTQ